MNCIIIDDDPIILKQLSSFISKSELLILKGTYSNPVEAFDAIKANDIDIIFLDIEMPEMSGLEYLEEIDSKYKIIVISGDRKYALETFEFGVTDYLLKPIEYSRFLKAINKIVERNCNFENDLDRDRFFIKVNNDFVRIPLDDIIMIDYVDEQVVIATKRKQYKIKPGLIDINKFFTLPCFYKINKFCLVNKNEIVDVCNNELIFNERYQLDNLKVDNRIGEELLKDIKQ